MTRTHKIALVIAATLTLLVGLALFQAARQAASHPDKGALNAAGSSCYRKSRLADLAAARPARRSAAGQPPAGQIGPWCSSATPSARICPTTLAELRQLLGSLPAEQRQQVQVLMVSVDPQRDTSPAAARLPGLFRSRLYRPLTGQLDDIQQLGQRLEHPLHSRRQQPRKTTPWTTAATWPCWARTAASRASTPGAAKPSPSCSSNCPNCCSASPEVCNLLHRSPPEQATPRTRRPVMRGARAQQPLALFDIFYITGRLATGQCHGQRGWHARYRHGIATLRSACTSNGSYPLPQGDVCPITRSQTAPPAPAKPVVLMSMGAQERKGHAYR